MEESEYGDFKEIEDEKKEEIKEQQVQTRYRRPRDKQLIGMVLERLGGKRMSIKTTDNKIRNCRVPGRFRRKFWLRPGNFVMIEPWPDDDDKGDIIYQYRPGEIIQLKKQGIADSLNEEF